MLSDFEKIACKTFFNQNKVLVDGKCTKIIDLVYIMTQIKQSLWDPAFKSSRPEFSDEMYLAIAEKAYEAFNQSDKCFHFGERIYALCQILDEGIDIFSLDAYLGKEYAAQFVLTAEADILAIVIDRICASNLDRYSEDFASENDEKNLARANRELQLFANAVMVEPEVREAMTKELMQFAKDPDMLLEQYGYGVTSGNSLKWDLAPKDCDRLVSLIYWPVRCVRTPKNRLAAVVSILAHGFTCDINSEQTCPAEKCLGLLLEADDLNDASGILDMKAGRLLGINAAKDTDELVEEYVAKYIRQNCKKDKQGRDS